jgi:hypothetical protein
MAARGFDTVAPLQTAGALRPLHTLLLLVHALLTPIRAKPARLGDPGFGRVNGLSADGLVLEW